ncbi:12129_t:CDS:2 [Cetraspora pellucida]|uniref:12129_t:CDS:1 n=1 Tax=Cetraspora pellucida TaxID=1433469 RepID=A0ACA9KBH5_9GLOM|nr:12129_t:CDS:2 [Cetraspora pellucida]
MLLWEIAETELPFAEYKYEVDIRNKILEDPIRLPFKSHMPIKWEMLVLKATSCDPDKRPQFKKILAKLKDLSDTTAKYYKAHYLYKNFLEPQCSREQRLNQAAKLFKETADDSDMTISQYYYASAFEYFCKAAHKGDASSMFNVGNMYYEGVGVEKNVKEGIHWIKMAAYNDVASAVKLWEERISNFKC